MRENMAYQKWQEVSDSKVFCVRCDVTVSHLQRFHERRKGLVCHAKTWLSNLSIGQKGTT